MIWETLWGDLMAGEDFSGLLSSRAKREHLLSIEIEKIQELGWDFFNAVKGDDIRKRDKCFRLLLIIASEKEGLKSLQEYFEGTRIGHKQDQITEEMAIKYVFYIVQNVRGMTDDRVKPTPMAYKSSLEKDV